MEYGKGHPKKYGYLEIQNTVDAAWPGLSPLVAPPTKTDLDKNWNWFQLQIIASNQTQSQWDRILVWYQTSPRNKKMKDGEPATLIIGLGCCCSDSDPVDEVTIRWCSNVGVLICWCSCFGAVTRWCSSEEVVIPWCSSWLEVVILTILAILVILVIRTNKRSVNV